MCLLTDNTWALVPEWMTSRETCSRCQLAEVPEVSLLAMLELKAALDALPPLAAPPRSAPKTTWWRRVAEMEETAGAAN